jgi:hypothetical protein
VPAAFARHQHLHFPLLADFEKDEVAKKIPRLSSERGRLRTRAVRPRPTRHDRMELLLPDPVNPGADGIIDALEKLSDQDNAHGDLEDSSHAK